MKNKNNFFGRIYALEIFLMYFHETGDFYTFNKINKDILLKINIEDIFLDIFNITKEEVNINYAYQLLNYISDNYHQINQIRTKYQIRLNKSLDHILIIILNMAIGEYIMSDLSKKIIISQYINICSIFHNATNLIHGILDRTFKELTKPNNNLLN